jgi:hypothetical protein
VRSLPVPTADITKPTNVLFRGSHGTRQRKEDRKRENCGKK